MRLRGMVVLAVVALAAAGCFEQAVFHSEFYIASTDDRPVTVQQGRVFDNDRRTIDEEREVDGVTDFTVFYICGEDEDRIYLRVLDRVTGEVLHMERLDRPVCHGERWLWDGEQLERLPGSGPGGEPPWPDDLYREE